MATRYFLRGSGGRFAGSTGGGGGRGGSGGGGLPAGTRRGGPLSKSTGAGGGYTRSRGSLGRKVYTRGEVYKGPGGTTVGARRFVSQGRSASRDAMVMKVRNGRVTSEPPGKNGIVRGAVSGGTRSRPGSPVGRNPNVRYVSRTTAFARSNPLTAKSATLRGSGRALSARGAGRINRGQSGRVRSGYIVMYGPRRAA
jgi:hypothetical protein